MTVSNCRHLFEASWMNVKCVYMCPHDDNWTTRSMDLVVVAQHCAATAVSWSMSSMYCAVVCTVCQCVIVFVGICSGSNSVGAADRPIPVPRAVRYCHVHRNRSSSEGSLDGIFGSSSPFAPSQRPLISTSTTSTTSFLFFLIQTILKMVQY